MDLFSRHLSWLDEQRQEMADLLVRWANINTGSYNIEGLDEMRLDIEKEFGALGGRITTLDLPPHESIDNDGRIVSHPLGKAVCIRKRPEARLKIFLGIHYDTVYDASHSFQECARLDENRLRGPGVADAKGGLVVMLKALQALEQSPWAENVGWEALINPDEEIGSPGSAPLLIQAAKRNHIGLLFEPSLPNGALVGARKGSGNFTAVVRGRAAHAGRDPEQGRNAVAALAEFIVELNRVHANHEGITVNVANIKGGGALNVVPELAIAGFNVRVTTPEDQQTVENNIKKLVADVKRREGFSMNIHGGFARPPKQLDAKTLQLLELIRECGTEISLFIDWQPSGGASDGNILASAGLTTVDSLGVRGGNLHSPDEFVYPDSLPERAKLTALLLMKLASGKAM